MGIHFRNAIAPQDTNKRKQLRRTNERTNERRERFLSNKMTTIKRGFWCLCVSALLAGAMCQEGARRKVLDMHEAVVENATDAMMNGTMNGTDAMNATEGEEATDDAGTDGGETSEDDSRGKLFQFEALQDAAMNAADNAQEVAMNVGGRINETLQNVGGALNETVNRVNETVQGGLDRVNDFVEGIQGGDANATNATNATTMNDTMTTTDDAGADGGEESEDDSRRKLLDMHEAVMEEATDAMMNATMNATDAMMNGTMNGTMMNGTEEEHDHDH